MLIDTTRLYKSNCSYRWAICSKTLRKIGVSVYDLPLDITLNLTQGDLAKIFVHYAKVRLMQL